MALKFILSQCSAKMGKNINDPMQKAILLRFINEAARELYKQTDITGSVLEQVFKINGDQTVSLPADVGTIRAAREVDSQLPWHINRMRPRYNQFNWTDVWQNYRLKNKQPLQCTITNQSVGVITVKAIETPNIVVSLSGPTADAANITEVLVMDATSKQTVNQFLDYTVVRKDRVNNYDVTLSDVDGKVLTVIPNNVLAASYQILDVSLAPWLSHSTSAQDNYIELLYKKVLPEFVNDNDEFPANDNYDDVIVNKVMQLWAEEQGKADVAIAYDQKATRTLARIMEDQNAETEDMVALVANPHDGLLPRIGVGNRKRFNYYQGRR